jgi:hypothetical protein
MIVTGPTTVTVTGSTAGVLALTGRTARTLAGTAPAAEVLTVPLRKSGALGTSGTPGTEEVISTAPATFVPADRVAVAPTAGTEAVSTALTRAVSAALTPAVSTSAVVSAAVPAARPARRLGWRERELLSRGHRPIIARTAGALCSPRPN